MNNVFNDLSKVRIPKPNDVGRKIEFISTEEIAEAMYIVTSKSFGIYRKDLYTSTARVFGFNRTGGNIFQAMEDSYNYLVNNHRVKEIDGKITLVSNGG